MLTFLDSILTVARRRMGLTGVFSSALGLLALASVIAYASIPSSEGVIYGCYKRSGGLMRIVDYPSDECDSRAENMVSWNQTGPEGPQGIPGEAGASNAYYTMEHSQVDLPDQGAFRTIAALRDLPAGSYMLTAHTTAVNPGQSLAAVRCAIRAAGQDSYGTWGSATAVGMGPGLSWFAQSYVSLAVNSDQPFDAEFYCHDTTWTPNAYVEESRLAAVTVSNVEIRPNAVP
jgi:hypothetical protein